jgi:hypothetical protein
MFGRVHHLHDGKRHGLGQSLSAKLLREGEAHPASLAEPSIGVRESGRSDHACIRQLRAMLVSDGVERRQNVARQLVRFIQDRRDEIAVEIRKAARRREIIDPRNVVECIGDLIDWCVVRHSATCLTRVATSLARPT